MGALLLKLRTWWETADRTQRAVTLFGGVFLVVLLGGTFFFASRPKMTMAFGGLTPSDVGTVTAEIQKLGIPVEFDTQGNVLVPSSQVAEVRAKLAVAGKLPASAHIGNEELAKLGMMNTPAVERERIKSILEGELSQSIEQIEGVGKARVHITLGERTAFAAEKKPSTASVVIQEQSGGVDQSSARAIAMMVANGVPGLEPAKVFVVDNAGRALYDGNEQSSLGGMATQKLEAERAEALRRERDIQAKLDAVIGRGNSVVTVNVEMDFDRETKEVSELKPNKNPLYVEEATEQVGGGAATSTAAPGVGSNTPGTAPGENTTTESSNGNGYSGTKKMAEYPYTKTDAKTEKAIGGIKKLSIAVMVNDEKVTDATPVEEYLQSYVGENAGFTAAVTSMKFDTTLEDEAKKTAAANAGQERMQQMLSLLPVAALLIVAVVVLKAIAKAAKAQTVMVHALPDGTLMATGGGLPAGRSTHHEGNDSTHAYADHHHDEPHSANSNHEGLPQLQRRGIGQTEDVGDIEERMNRPLEQLKRMAADRPDSVGLLIKSWMLEERR